MYRCIEYSAEDPVPVLMIRTILHICFYVYVYKHTSIYIYWLFYLLYDHVYVLVIKLISTLMWFILFGYSSHLQRLVAGAVPSLNLPEKSIPSTLTAAESQSRREIK